MPTFDDTKQNEQLKALHAREEEELIRALSQKYGHQYTNLHTAAVNTDALKLVPEDIAREGKLVPFEKINQRLHIAIRNPNNPKAKEVLSGLTEQGFELKIFMTSTASLERAWARYKDLRKTTAVRKGVFDIASDEISEVAHNVKEREDLAKEITKMTQGGTKNVSEILEVIVGGALALRASDIHIEPEEEVIRLRFRLDGVLFDITDLNQKIYPLMRSRIKLLSGLKLNVNKKAQDGRFTIEVGEKEIEIRSSVIPGGYGESIVMRILDPGTVGLELEELGINNTLFSIIQEELKRPNGMIITTGPTGSGKTTSLYAFLRSIHKPEVKIITLEDPIEYHLDGIVQTQVEKDYTFASGLRSILRQDPDVILVGEIRDQEVAETAVNAALTGHLVFSTLHTNDAVGAFPRLVDLGVDRESLGSALNLVLAQRLVRRLCPECKEAYTPNEEEFTILKPYIKESEFPTLYKPGACEACGDNGYRGRVGIYEGIRVDGTLETAVTEHRSEMEILQTAREQGIPTMQEDGVSKLLQGVTSLPELTRVIDLQNSVVLKLLAPKEVEEKETATT